MPNYEGESRISEAVEFVFTHHNYQVNLKVHDHEYALTVDAGPHGWTVCMLRHEIWGDDDLIPMILKKESGQVKIHTRLALGGIFSSILTGYQRLADVITLGFTWMVREIFNWGATDIVFNDVPQNFCGPYDWSHAGNLIARAVISYYEDH